MKKESLCAGFVLLVILSLTSVGAKQEGEEYFPMSDGARWEYVTKYCVGSNCNDGKLTSSIDGEETIDGKKYYKFVTIGHGVSGQKISYNRKAEEGIFSSSAGHKDKPEQLVLPIPLSVGKTWTFQSYEPFLATSKNRVVGKEALNLHDKKYENCFKVSTQGLFEEGKLQGNKIEVTVYYAPNIGLVKSVMHDSKNGITYERTLTKYEP
jgi:hypothetical protein